MNAGNHEEKRSQVQGVTLHTINVPKMFTIIRNVNFFIIFWKNKKIRLLENARCMFLLFNEKFCFNNQQKLFTNICTGLRKKFMLTLYEFYQIWKG